ncbi:MAG: transposase [Methylocella sp.]
MENPGHPIGGVDYVRTFREMDNWFARDVKCREYIRRLRWPAGFACPDRGITGEPWEMAPTASMPAPAG